MYRKLKDKLHWLIYQGLYKPGHFYSPIPSLDEVASRRQSLFSKKTPIGIDLNLKQQQALLKVFEKFSIEFDWPNDPVPDYRYYQNNMFFNKADAFILYS